MRTYDDWKLSTPPEYDDAEGNVDHDDTEEHVDPDEGDEGESGMMTTGCPLHCGHTVCILRGKADQ